MSYNKSKSALPEKSRFILFEIGLIIAISAALVAFNYKVERDYRDICTLPIPPSGDIEQVIPRTIQKPEMPQPPALPVFINIVDNGVDVEDDFYTPAENYVPEIPEEQALEEPPIDFPAIRPHFPGGDAALLQFIKSQIEYPVMAVNVGISGTVYLSFVVSKDGTIRDIEVLRGPGGGLEEEAIRVVKLMPPWEPGIQNGKPVNVRFRMPIKFVLQ